MATTRPATKAGTWYKREYHLLLDELKRYLAAVPESLNGVSLPIPGARVIIAP
jgi:predicted class III extradiol MEMO1 family dioxygenase